VLRRIFGPKKKDEVMGGCKRPHNEEICDVYSSPITIKTIKVRRMRWAGHAALMGRGEMRIEFWWESQK
jgi:hypothetical protein